MFFYEFDDHRRLSALEGEGGMFSLLQYTALPLGASKLCTDSDLVLKLLRKRHNVVFSFTSDEAFSLISASVSLSCHGD